MLNFREGFGEKESAEDVFCLFFAVSFFLYHRPFITIVDQELQEKEKESERKECAITGKCINSGREPAYSHSACFLLFCPRKIKTFLFFMYILVKEVLQLYKATWEFSFWFLLKEKQPFMVFFHLITFILAYFSKTAIFLGHTRKTRSRNIRDPEIGQSMVVVVEGKKNTGSLSVYVCVRVCVRKKEGRKSNNTPTTTRITQKSKGNKCVANIPFIGLPGWWKAVKVLVYKYYFRFVQYLSSCYNLVIIILLPDVTCYIYLMQ